MNQYLSSASLKSLAKGQLLGKYGILTGILAMHILCTVPVSFPFPPYPAPAHCYTAPLPMLSAFCPAFLSLGNLSCT